MNSLENFHRMEEIDSLSHLMKRKYVMIFIELFSSLPKQGDQHAFRRWK
jgi:hypothetical protein